MCHPFILTELLLQTLLSKSDINGSVFSLAVHNTTLVLSLAGQLAYITCVHVCMGETMTDLQALTTLCLMHWARTHGRTLL